MSFPAVVQLSALNGTNGFRLDGIDANDRSGFSVASAGDVNGDGLDDVIIGTPLADPGGRSYAGESYVVFGRTGSFASSLALSTLDGTNGFRLDGIDADDASGRSVAGAGDVNGDGVDDLIVGAFRANPGGHGDAGESYVVFGQTGFFASSFELSALNGSNGFRLDGIDQFDYSGISVAGAGDVNGDGIDDLIVGAYGADPDGRNSAGESYVVFGRTGSFAAVLELSILNGGNGFRLDGIRRSDFSGLSVSGAGDVNGDGIDDLIIGAEGADPGGRTSAGQSYVVFGRTGSFASALELSGLNGTNGFRLDGIVSADFSGVSVSGSGDVNGDGIDDLIIGAGFADPGGRYSAGESYVVFGRTGSFASAFALSALDGRDGFRLSGIDGRDYAGLSVSGAGDVNGDGIDDLIIGAKGADRDGHDLVGESYVVFGHTGSFASALELSGLNGINGFRLDGIDLGDSSGLSVAGAGDVNRDGIDDLIIGAPYADPGGRFGAGESYVVFGVPTIPVTTPIVGTAGNDSLPGTAASDTIVGLAGNDTLSGLAGNDTLRGDGGSDSLVGGGGNDSLLGGTGDDRLRGYNGNDTLLGQAGEDDLSGGNGDDRLVGGDSADRLHGGTGADTFVFLPDASLASLGDAADVIADFSVSDGDVINLQKLNLPDYAALQALFTETVDGTVIDLTPVGGRDVLVAGVTLAELDQQANFVL